MYFKDEIQYFQKGIWKENQNRQNILDKNMYIMKNIQGNGYGFS